MTADRVSSFQNPRIKSAVRLRDRRDRDRTGKFLIEGYRELLRASEAGLPLETLFICPELFLGSNEPALIAAFSKSEAQILRCPEPLFRKISYRDRPDGLVAIAPKPDGRLRELPEGDGGLFVVAEAVEKPGNLGTILRSCDAAGASGLIVCDRCTDLYNPNVVRASVGTLFTVPAVEASSEETLCFLKERGVSILAATPSAERLYTEAEMRGPVAIAVGTEQLGLSEKWMEAADIRVRIPMLGKADSLNVATATTLLLYEALRQRS